MIAVLFIFISVNGQYASQGKLGAAVLANHVASDVSCEELVFSFRTARCSLVINTLSVYLYYLCVYCSVQ